VDNVREQLKKRLRVPRFAWHKKAEKLEESEMKGRTL
jgi:hypothetical protein